MRMRNRIVVPLLVAFGLLACVRQTEAGPILTDEIAQYLAIGTGNAGVGVALNVQKAEWGRISEFVSTDKPNLASQFDQPPDATKMRWNSTTNTTYSPPLPPSAPVGEGPAFTGHSAITSPTGRYGVSTTDWFSTGFSIRCASPATTASGGCLNSVGSPQVTPWYNGTEPPTNAGDVGAGAGVVGSYNHSTLIADLQNAWNFINAATPEFTLTSDLVSGSGDLDPFTPGIQTLQSFDTAANGLGLVVIDILVDGDFDVNNFDWIIDGNSSTFGIFRVRGNSNMNMSNSSIALGPGGIGGGSATTAPTRLGAIFVQYQDTNRSDAVFSMNNTIVNGVGFWDLNAFQGGQYNDSVSTDLNVQNSQGCTQFISSSVLQTSDSRFSRCSGGTTQVPEPALLSLLGGGLAAVAIRRRRRTE